MTARGTAHGSGGALSRLSPSVRLALAAGLLALGIGDLAAINLVLLPRHFAGDPGTRKLPSLRPRGALAVAPAVESPSAKLSAAPVVASPAAAPVPAPVAVAPAPTLMPVPPLPPVDLPAPPVAPAPVPVAAVAPAPPAPSPPVEGGQEGENQDYPYLLFARNAHWLSPDSRATLNQLAEVLNLDPERRVLLSGHADTVGDPEFNRWLSLARARRAGRYLQDKGVDKARIGVKSFGSARPAEGEPVSGVLARNRRVEIAVY
jgi:outer membrane protein OmpA-like peptidoglycan-associated protein